MADKYQHLRNTGGRECRNRQGIVKKAYADQASADAAAAIYNQERGLNLHGYKCGFCDRYHIGHPRRSGATTSDREAR